MDAYSKKAPLLTVSSKKGNYVLVVHGGAGAITRDKSTPEKEREYKHMLTVALHAGYDVLKSGGEAMDAACAAVKVLEGLVISP